MLKSTQKCISEPELLLCDLTQSALLYTPHFLQKYYEKCANLVLASRNLEHSVDRQQKLEKVMDEEGLPDEEVTNTHT